VVFFVVVVVGCFVVVVVDLVVVVVGDILVGTIGVGNGVGLDYDHTKQKQPSKS
jgi:hypothetical protein